VTVSSITIKHFALSTTRVRFAPSPTGFLHVGGLRTALYNYLLAKKQNGTFILRIEDTDRNRFIPGAVENLIRTLRWAGLTYDEGPEVGGDKGPYVQSERTELYRQAALKLVSERNAYYDFTGSEEEDAHEDSASETEPPQHAVTRRAHSLSTEEVQKKLAAGEPAAIRMKVPEGRTIAFDDVIRGHVEFSSDLVNDQVLLKSDGYPTYHLANVVDDHQMGVTHVIRGEEWLSSTPKHVLLYEYFGWTPPVFAHLPLLLNPDRTKLSKRQGDVAVEDYQRKGYLPEALVNFIALLGWNPGDEREIFSLEELGREFTLDRVGKSGAVFNLEKLNSVNKQYMRAKADADLVPLVRPFLQAGGVGDVADAYLEKVIRLTKERVTTLCDFAEVGDFFFADPQRYDEEARKKNWKAESPRYLAEAIEGIKTLAGFSGSEIEALVRATAERLGVGPGKLIHPLRLAITGKATGPGLFELMEVLGKDACARRIERALTSLV
jgi:glutamyl-tRNA synthetase